MEYIDLAVLGLEETRSMFLGIPESRSLEEIATELHASEVSFNDLDHCVADCLATKLPGYFLINGGLPYIELGMWGVRSAGKLVAEEIKKLRGRIIEEPWEDKAWKEFYNKFLDNEKILRELEILADSRKHELLYPGVEDFYSVLDIPSALVTRNIPSLTEPVARRIGVDMVITDAFDKNKGISQAAELFGPFVNYIFLGDYTTFISARDWLKKNKEGATNILVSQKKGVPSEVLDLVDLQIGRNYNPLTKLLQKYE